MTGRWLVLVTVSLALVAAGIVSGVVQRTILADDTGIVWFILAVGLIGTWAARWRPSLNDWLCEHGITVFLGLLGTVVGFMGAIEGAVIGNTAAKLAGVETALSTTVVGVVLQLHLLVLQRGMRSS